MAGQDEQIWSMGSGGQERPAPTPVVYPVFPPALLGV